MKAPKIPKHTLEKVATVGVQLNTDLENANKTFEHLVELDEWRVDVTKAIEQLQNENGALRVRIRNLEREIKQLKG